MHKTNAEGLHAEIIEIQRCRMNLQKLGDNILNGQTLYNLSKYVKISKKQK